MSSVEELRVRIGEVGRQVAIAEEMIRLGFLTVDDLQSVSLDEQSISATIAELKPTLEQLKEAETKLATLGDLPGLLKEIRAERIAMVKARREERKVQQERERIERRAAWEVKKRTEAPFLGVGVSEKLDFTGGDPEKLASMSLPVFSTLVELSTAMGFEPADLVWLCYERGATTVDHYTRFEIPKRSGGGRLISSPKPKMRKAQTWINENILSQLVPSKYCYAFRPGTSIVDNAKQHLNKSILVKFDLKDFFPSITFSRVRGYFQYLGYNPGISTVLALLCTDAPRARVTVKGISAIVALGERSLPQGACTSPALANLIASRLDNRLSGFAAYLDEDWTYTRYADDLTFSTSDAEADLAPLMGAVKRIAVDERFEINLKKTKVMRSPKRQSVTGLIVSSEVRIPKKVIKQIRALFHNIETKGEEAVSESMGKNALNVAHGFWSYMHMVEPELAATYLKKHPWLSTRK
jgi:retron-type reverse transcriptase